MAKKEKDDFEVVKFRAKHSQIDNNKGGFFSFTFGIQDLSKIDWSDFMVNYIRAIATFILKEDPSTFVISPNRRLQILHFLHLLLIFMIVCILLTILSYFDPFDILVSLWKKTFFHEKNWFVFVERMTSEALQVLDLSSS